MTLSEAYEYSKLTSEDILKIVTEKAVENNNTELLRNICINRFFERQHNSNECNIIKILTRTDNNKYSEELKTLYNYLKKPILEKAYSEIENLCFNFGIIKDDLYNQLTKLNNDK